MQAIKRLKVNEVDLEHEGHLGNVGTVPRFPTMVALSEYSRRTGRSYRKDLVPCKSLLKILQRHILDPQPEQAENMRMDDTRRKMERRKG